MAISSVLENVGRDDPDHSAGGVGLVGLELGTENSASANHTEWMEGYQPPPVDPTATMALLRLQDMVREVGLKEMEYPPQDSTPEETSAFLLSNTKLHAKVSAFKMAIEIFDGRLAAALLYEVEDLITILDFFSARHHNECQAQDGLCFHFKDYFDIVGAKLDRLTFNENGANAEEIGISEEINI